MALDRQKILNELGSVVNQLQSADCGCMGKLFSDPNGCQAGANMKPQATYGMCGHGHCHNYGAFNSSHGHGFSAPCAGASCARNMCMGSCNPPKLYADTYSYLNQNLMQPVVKEVYDDLKSITPENTIMNSPMGAKMGLPISGGPQMNGDMRTQQNQMAGMNSLMQNMQSNMHQNQMPNNTTAYHVQGDQPQYQMQDGSMGYQRQPMDDNIGMQKNLMQGNQMMPVPGQQITHQRLGHTMGGMGPDIVKMMASAAREARAQRGGQTGSMVPKDPQLTTVQGGVNPGQINNVNAGMYQGQENNNPGINQRQYDTYAAMNQGQYDIQTAEGMNQYDTNAAMNSTNQQMNIPVTQNVNNPNMAFTPNAQQPMNANMQQGQGDQSFYNTQMGHQIAPPAKNYGQHAQGMAKFNEMFPGVTNGDLGFDPMSIAIQMNPANHQKAAMMQMQKIMDGNKFGNSTHSSHMETAVAGANNARANMSAMSQQQRPPINQQGLVSAPIMKNQQGNFNTTISPNQQQVYAANTGAPTYNQGQPTQQMPSEQQIADPNTGAAEVTSDVPPSNNGPLGDNNAHQQNDEKSDPEMDYAKMVIKEPIFPVDTSRFQVPLSMKRPKYYGYNTLGQPVEMLPAKLYRPSSPLNVPQTLSPQPVTKLRNDYSRLNLKQTESKTSLMGNKPVGRTPSRNQMQHIYRQYKGSQSHTLQRVQSPTIVTYSERKFNIPQQNVEKVRQAPIEKVGGDTAANNSPSMMNAMPEKGYPQHVEQHGDASADKPYGESIPTPTPVKRIRNGLQDQVYTAYPSSTAWSFHGERNAPFSTGFRLRAR